METGDWIALAAVVLSVGAAAVSVHQAKTAKQSAQAAQVQADAAREANQLTRQQMTQQAAREHQEGSEAMAAAQREAEKVHLVFSGNGGSLMVDIANDGRRAVAKVELLDVTPVGEGPWRSWKPNPNVGHQLSSVFWPLLQPGQKESVAVWLLDENGEHVRTMPEGVLTELRFRDDDGQWWMATGEETRRIAAPVS